MRVKGQPEPQVGQRWRAAFRGHVRELIRLDHNDDGEPIAVLYSPDVPHKVVRIEARKLGVHPWRWRIYDPEASAQRAEERRRVRVGSWWMHNNQIGQVSALFYGPLGLQAVMCWDDDGWDGGWYPTVADMTAANGWAPTEAPAPAATPFIIQMR